MRRCRERVYLGISDLSEAGFEQRGPLLTDGELAKDVMDSLLRLRVKNPDGCFG